MEWKHLVPQLFFFFLLLLYTRNHLWKKMSHNLYSIWWLKMLKKKKKIKKTYEVDMIIYGFFYVYFPPLYSTIE